MVVQKKKKLIYLEDEAKWDGLVIPTWEQNPFRIFILDSFLVLSGIFCNPLHLFLMRKEILLLFIFHLQAKKDSHYTLSKSLHCLWTGDLPEQSVLLHPLCPKARTGKESQLCPFTSPADTWTSSNPPHSAQIWWSTLSGQQGWTTTLFQLSRAEDKAGLWAKAWQRFRFLTL